MRASKKFLLANWTAPHGLDSRNRSTSGKENDEEEEEEEEEKTQEIDEIGPLDF